MLILSIRSTAKKLLPILAIALISSAPAHANNKNKGGKKNKTPVCHVTPSGRVIELQLPVKAAAKHIAHGDYIGGESGCVAEVHSEPEMQPEVEMQPEPEKQPVPSYRIMAIGDSITEGVYGEQSYRKPLVELLDNTGCDYQMVGGRTTNETPTMFESPHEGYSGHRVDFFTEARGGNPGIDSIMNDHMPDILLLHLGSNDMFVGEPITGDYQADGKGGTIAELELLVTKIWNINPEAEIYAANVIPWYGVSDFNPNVIENTKVLTSAITDWVAMENDSRLHLVDVSTDYQESYMQADLIHPGDTGEAFLANTFLSALNNNGVCQ